MKMDEYMSKKYPDILLLIEWVDKFDEFADYLIEDGLDDRFSEEIKSIQTKLIQEIGFRLVMTRRSKTDSTTEEQ